MCVVWNNSMKYKIYLPSFVILLKAYVPIFKYFGGIFIVGTIFVSWTESDNDWETFIAIILEKLNIVPEYIWILAVNFVLIPYIAIIFYRLFLTYNYCSKNRVSFYDFHLRPKEEIKALWDKES